MGKYFQTLVFSWVLCFSSVALAYPHFGGPPGRGFAPAPAYRAPAYVPPAYHAPVPAPAYRQAPPVYRQPTYQQTPPSAYRPVSPPVYRQAPQQQPVYHQPTASPIAHSPGTVSPAPMVRSSGTATPVAPPVATQHPGAGTSSGYHPSVSVTAPRISDSRNRFPPVHMARVDQANERMNRVMVANPHVNAFVAPHAQAYVSTFRPVVVNQYNVYVGYCNHWRGYYGPWVRYGFFGGFGYPLYPVYDIQLYFGNPLILWLYVGAWDEMYYRTWFEASYDRYDSLRTHFSVPGVFYPTQELTHLTLGVSGMSYAEQGNFMLAMNDLVYRLTNKLSEKIGTQAVLNRNEIVVNHYEMFNSALVLEGFVSTPNVQFPFKTVLDLRSDRPDLSNRIFVPSTDGSQPTEVEQYELQELNRRIMELGGTVNISPAPLNPY